MHAILCVILATVAADGAYLPEGAAPGVFPKASAASLEVTDQIVVEEESGSGVVIVHPADGAMQSARPQERWRVVPQASSVCSRAASCARFRQPVFPEYYYHRPYDRYLVFDYPWHKSPAGSRCCSSPGAGVSWAASAVKTPVLRKPTPATR